MSSTSTSPRVLRLALLVCDTPAPHIAAKHGDYPYLFRRLFRRALSTLPADSSLEIDITDFDVVHSQQYPSDEDFAASRFDGIVITGSSFSAYQDLPWIKKLINFVRHVRQQHAEVRILGICFGHQIVATAFGGTCEKNSNGWEFGCVENRLTELGKKILGTDRSILKLQEVHQDHVPTVPPDFDLLATTSPHTAVQSLVSHDRRILTVQGHPEFPAEFVDALLDLRLGRGILTEEFVKESKKTLWASDVDDVWLCRRFIEFLQGSLED